MSFMRAALLALLALHLAHATDSVPKEIYRARRVQLSRQLGGQCALIFAESESDYHSQFRQDNNFYYLTGWTQPDAVLLIAAEAPPNPSYSRPYSEILFLPAKVTALIDGPRLNAATPNITTLAGVERVESITALLEQLLPYQSSLFFTDRQHSTPFSAATLTWLEKFMLRPNAFPDAGPLLKDLRATKDRYEIELMRKAADASVTAHLAAMHAIKPDLKEYDVAAVMEYELRKAGCERTAYQSIVASGANAAFSHHYAGSSKLAAGDLVTMDVAGEYSMYASDVTRTLPVSGKFTDRQRELYRIVRGAELAVIAAFQSGKSRLYSGPDSLQGVYIAYMNSHELGKYVRSAVGHPVGLNVHDGGESPVALTGTLGPGSIFNIEPAIYIPQEKLGIQIEDTFLVDASGKLVCLTAKLPVEPEDIERAMAQR